MEHTQSTSLSVVGDDERSLVCIYGCGRAFKELHKYNYHALHEFCTAKEKLGSIERDKIVEAFKKRKENAKNEGKKCPVCGTSFTRAANCRKHMKIRQAHEANERGVEPPVPARPESRVFIKKHLEHCGPCGEWYLSIKEHKKEHACGSKSHYREKAAAYCEFCDVWYTPVLDHGKRHEGSKRHRRLTGDKRIPRLPKPKGPRKVGKRIKDETCQGCGEKYLRRRRYEHLRSARHRKWIEKRESMSTLEIAMEDWKENGMKKYLQEIEAAKRRKSAEPPTDYTFENEKCFTQFGWKKFCEWKDSPAGQRNPEDVSVADILKAARPGPMKVDFVKPLTRKKAFEGWASAVTPQHRHTAPEEIPLFNL